MDFPSLISVTNDMETNLSGEKSTADTWKKTKISDTDAPRFGEIVAEGAAQTIPEAPLPWYGE